MSKKKAKRVTLRQRMRKQAEGEINAFESLVVTGVERALEEAGVDLDPYDVMRLFGNSQTKYLREKAVISLANQYEAELEALYNRQQELAIGDMSNLIPKKKEDSDDE